ncbi:MAG TPA: hypothetical protein VNF68_05335 [Candidatus Baltobacteraceae bacterium]|nr:hypothetical protein [Candidatus Baltobacteraceae bacterium]
MIVRSDKATLLEVAGFAFSGTAALKVDKTMVEVVGAWYRLGGARIELAFERRRLRGSGRFQGGTLELEVRALAPIRERDVLLTVQGDGEPVNIALELEGSAVILPARIVCEGKLYDESRTLELRLSIPNDGVADCREAALKLTPGTPGVIIESVRREGVRLAVSYDRKTPLSVLAPFEAAVGATVTLGVTLVAEPGVESVVLVAEVLGDETLCEYHSPAFTLPTLPTTLTTISDAASVVLPMRAGVIATIENRAGRLDDVRLVARAPHLTEASIELGAILPDEVRRLPFDVQLESADATLVEIPVEVTLEVAGVTVVTSTVTVAFVAPPSLCAKVEQFAIGDRGDVQFEITVGNVGFGPATDRVLRLSTDADLTYVADSLLIDDVSYAAVDGRWNAAEPIALPRIDPGAKTVVSFRVRSVGDAKGAMVVRVAQGAQDDVRIESVFALRAYKDATTVAESPRPAAVESTFEVDAEAVAQPAPVPIVPERGEAEGELRIEIQPSLLDPVEPDLSNTADPADVHDDEPESDGEEFALSPDALEMYGDGNVALGRHVLVVLSRAPDGLHSAVKALFGQYVPGLREGAFALTGHAYDSPALRAALKAALEGAGERLAPDAPASEVLARAMALCSLPGPQAEPFAEYRDQVISAVKQAKTDDDYDASVVDAELLGVAA